MEKRKPKHSNSHNGKLAITVFAISFVLLLLMYMYLVNTRKKLQEQELHYIAANTAAKVTKVISERIWKCGTLATLIIQGNGKLDDFEKVSAILVDDPAIRNITLAPGGIVEKIYPLEGNERLLGLDYLGSGGSEESRSAVESGLLTLAGPFELVQGGQGLTGRLPVYLDQNGRKEFWGFVGIALNYPQVLEEAFLGELYHHGYSGEIWRIDPSSGQRQSIWRSEGGIRGDAATDAINLFNVTWHIDVSRTPDTDALLEWLTALLVILFISVLFGLLSYHYLELRTMKLAMEELALTDPLTKMPNRRALMFELPKTASYAKVTNSSFTVIYMDLDGLKMVNDKLGHLGGDRVLYEFSRILEECVGNTGMATRVGGDEFVLLLHGIGPGKELDYFLKTLREKTTFAFSGDGEYAGVVCRISSSQGVATYPQDGEDIEQLLHIADKRLYEYKRNNRPVTAEGFKPHFR